VVLRAARILQSVTPAKAGAAEHVAAQPKPEVLPQFKAPRARDIDHLERLRKIATEKATTKAESDAPCNRRTRRKSTALPALLTFKTMRLQLPCQIVDMSGTGARLALPEASIKNFGDLNHLPGTFTLVMRTDRMQVECEVKWRKTTTIGVRFLGAPVPLPKPAR
jgi:hypothetical protein